MGIYTWKHYTGDYPHMWRESHGKTIIAICSSQQLDQHSVEGSRSNEVIVCRVHITSPLQLLTLVKQLKQLLVQCTESNVTAAKSLPHRFPSAGDTRLSSNESAGLSEPALSLADSSDPTSARCHHTAGKRHMLRLTVGVRPRHLAFAILLNWY